MKPGCVLLVCVLACQVFGKESNVDNLVHKNHDRIQEDILSAMKDSGVLKEWKDKIDKLDHILNDNEIDTEKLQDRKSFLSQLEKEMLSSFIDEYISEQKLEVSTDLIISIVDRVQKSPKPNLPQIFVQLGPVIEVVSALSKKTPDLLKLIDRQGPVFDSPAKTKDVLHTLAENLKSELVRLTLKTPPKSSKKSPPPPPKKEKAKKKEAGLEDYLTNFFQSGNANQLLSLLSGSADLPKLLSGGNLGSILSTVVGAYFQGSPYGPLIQQYGARFLESEQGVVMMDGFNSLLENVAVSESGQRLVKLMPQLLATKDIQSLLEILGEEAEWNWTMFFDNIDNKEYRTDLVEILAEYGVKGYDLVLSPPSDSVLAQLPLMINGFLISYRIPAFDSQAPTKSLIAMLNKCVRLFTVWKLDTTPYVNQAHQAVTETFKKQLNGRLFAKLSTEEKKSLLSHMIDSELISPVQTVWAVYIQAVSQPQCSEQFMCILNQRVKKSSQGQTRQAVVVGASLAASWTLSHATQSVYWSLYNAVMAGSKGADCLASYPSARDSCKLADRPKRSAQSTHVEL